MTAKLGRPPVLADIVEEHFDELDFLWASREAMICAPSRTLADVAEIEERAEAHLDGLRLAEMHAVDLARKHVLSPQTFAATAATLVLLETETVAHAREVVEALQVAEAPAADRIRIGLLHSRIVLIQDELLTLAMRGELPTRAAAADVLSFHRIAPPDVRSLFASRDIPTLVSAYRVLGRLSEMTERQLASGLASESPVVQRAALEAAARTGVPALRTHCSDAATRSVSPSIEALSFLGVLGHPGDAQLLRDALNRADRAEAALRGLGTLGRVAYVPALLEAMRIPGLARAAGEAFTRITGARVPEGERPPLTAHDESEPEDADGLPDVTWAEEYWKQHATEFDPAMRWQVGSCIPTARLPADFVGLPLVVRRDVYLSARAESAASIPDLELEARAVTQLALK